MKKNYRVVPASQGKQWLVESWRIFSANRVAFVIPLTLFLILLSLASTPFFGVVAAVLTPLLVAGILKGVAAGADSGSVRINLFALWGEAQARNKLLILGALLYLLSQLIILLFGMNQVQLEDILTNPDLEAARQLRQKILLMIGVNFAIAGSISWFTIPLLALAGRSLAEAVPLALGAVLANWRAFLLLTFWYLLLTFVGTLLALVLSSLLLMVLGGLPLGQYLAMLPTFGFFLLLFILAYISQYLSWRDVFGGESKTVASDSEEPPPSRVVI